MVSKAMEDLPEPEMPVTTTNFPLGIERSKFFRLLALAPLMNMHPSCSIYCLVTCRKSLSFLREAIILSSSRLPGTKMVAVTSFSPLRASFAKNARIEALGSDLARIKEIMPDYQETQKRRNELARQLGSDVII